MPPPQPLTYQRLKVRNILRNTYWREAVPKSPAFSLSADKGQASRTYYIAWAQAAGLGTPLGPTGAIKQAWEDFCGYNLTTTDNSGATPGGKYIARMIPDEMLTFAGGLYAEHMPQVTGVTIATPAKDNNGIGIYDEAEVTVVYTTRPYVVLTDAEFKNANGVRTGTANYDESNLYRYVSYQFVPGGYWQTVPLIGSLRWTSDKTPVISGKNVVLLSQSDLTITWWWVPWDAVPFSYIAASVGTTNNAPLGGNGSILPTQPTGTLLCLWPKIQDFIIADGSRFAHIHYQFRVYPNGANSLYRWNVPPTVLPSYQQVAFYDSNKNLVGPLFPSRDFKPLFRPDPGAASQALPPNWGG